MGGRGNDSKLSPLAKSLKRTENKIRKNDTESLYVYDSNGNLVFNTGDGKAAEVSVPEDKKHLFNNNIITHNHPHGYYLSLADIATFMQLNARELRATTPDGRAFVLHRKFGYHGYQMYYEYKNYEVQTSMTVARTHWDVNRSKAENRHACSVAQTELMNQWLKDNASKYGYEFRIEKTQR